MAEEWIHIKHCFPTNADIADLNGLSHQFEFGQKWYGLKDKK